MCCFFTYLMWTVDFIQRLWTFLMSCCIGGTVIILLMITSLAGIAFGYNYSVSEYYRSDDPKTYLMVTRDLSANKTAGTETQGQNSTNQNETISLFEDGSANELAEDEIPNSEALESDDQIKNENSLYTHDPWDVEMEAIMNKYPSGSVEQMKAIINHIYKIRSRKRLHRTTMKKAARHKPPKIGTTASPADYNAGKLKTLEESNQDRVNEYPTWRSAYLTLLDNQKPSTNSTPAVKV